MMKRFIVLAGFLMLSSCVPMSQYQAIEKRVASLETSRKLSLKQAMLLAEETGARKFWWRNALTGGGDALDGITGMSDGDAALIAQISGETTYGSWWIYDDDGTNSDYPTSCTTDCVRIKPDTGSGAWHLVNFRMQAGISLADDGYHYLDVSNSDGFDGTPAEGYCYYDDTDNDWCCYDGGSWLCASLAAP